MEFKKPNRSRNDRSSVGQKLGSNPVTHNPQSIRTAPPAPASKLTSRSDVAHVTSKKLKFLSRVRQLVGTKKVFIPAIIVILVVISYFALGALHQEANPTEKLSTRPAAISDETPEYETVSPKDKSIDKLGGWRRISPPEGEPVFAYSDKINNTPISVSQQPLPDSFKTGTDGQVAELAKKFNATTKIDADGTPVYIGTSAKGPQSVILAKNDVLILIKSQQKIEDPSWIEYIKSLN